MNAFQTLSEQTVIISLTLGKPGDSKKVKESEVEVLPSDEDGKVPDQARMRVSKILLNSKTLQEIGQKHGMIRRWLEDQCLPSKFMKNGYGILKATSILKVNNFLDQQEADLQVLKEKFRSEYPELVRVSMEELGALADPTNYPPIDKIMSKFVFMKQYLTFDIPRKVLGQISADLVQEEERKIQAQMQQVVENIEGNFVEMFSKIINHFLECLKPDAEGRKKKVTDKYVERFNEFFDMFTAKDIHTNPKLTEVIQQARDIVNGVTTKEMNTPGNMRDFIHAKMEEIKSAIEGTVSSQVSRKIRLPGLEPAQSVIITQPEQEAVQQ